MTLDFTKLKTSWTKFDIVQVLDSIYSPETIDAFKNGKIIIDEPILKSFLGIKKLSDPTPDYWIEIQKYPKEKNIFALLALIFTHGNVVKEFAKEFASDNMTGVFICKPGKQYTNIRSALVESGAAEPIYRRSPKVPYDISVIFYNTQVGVLFKQVLQERFSRLTTKKISDDEFFEICFENEFEKALGITRAKFKKWILGKALSSPYIQKILIKDFFSIKNIELDFNNSKEIYFLGENGDGKTLLLMSLYLTFKGNFIHTKTEKEQTGRVIDLLNRSTKTELMGKDNSGQEYVISKPIYLENIYAYGTQRGRYSTDRPEKYGFMSLFDSNQALIDPISWLKDLKLQELNTTTEKMDNFSCLTDALINIFYELLEKNVKIEICGDKVNFVEKGFSLTFDQLSEGYRSIILFVSDLFFRLNQNNTDKLSFKELSLTQGIVLVDEIDLHLHPRWQKIIIRKIRSLLPNIQFFFTTHSPTIIQGASEDSLIFRVYREDGETKCSDAYLRKDLNHLMINTLTTSPLFGLDDSRLDTNNDTANTDNDYMSYRINRKLRSRLHQLRIEGKKFLSDVEIDNLIDDIIEEQNDKNQ